MKQRPLLSRGIQLNRPRLLSKAGDKAVRKFFESPGSQPENCGKCQYDAMVPPISYDKKGSSGDKQK
jgi:hypothetical protein